MDKLKNVAMCIGLLVSLGLVYVALAPTAAQADPNFPPCGTGNKGDTTKDGVGNTYTCNGAGAWSLVKSVTVIAPAGTQQLNFMTGTIDYDFPPIGAAGDYAGCRDTPAFSVKNTSGAAVIGDPCFVGYKAPLPMDGGAASQNFEVTCQVVTPGFAALRGCCMQGDGGSCNVDDAGYVCACLQVF